MTHRAKFEGWTLPPMDRRRALQGMACGFGALATSAMVCQGSSPSAMPGTTGMHHAARAKRIIFLFMQGGVSQVDSFDYKPELARLDGIKHAFDDARQLAKTGKLATEHRVMQSPWRFRPYGQCGRMVSELFPESARHVDDLCFLHAMHTEGVAHGPATLFLHCGSTNFVRPSFGSWVLYGMGSENDNLPGFISISPSVGNGGPRNYGSAFLPARFQGTRLGGIGKESLEFANLNRSLKDVHQEQQRMQFLKQLNQTQIEQRRLHDSEFDAVIESYELAWRMQQLAPEVTNLDNETPATLSMYGIDQPETRAYGQKCLLARRLCEAGVRFIQVNYGDNSANPAWDQHSNIPKHADHARAVDRPIAGLLQDLKQRGLLEDTLVWWGGEFGRTPYAQENGTGRDHNPGGFTVWLAGGGVKSGFAHGETDDFGFQGIQGKVHMHDLHATLLHQLGMDHQRLTFRHAGRDFRLTDVAGRVVHDLIA